MNSFWVGLFSVEAVIGIALVGSWWLTLRRKEAPSDWRRPLPFLGLSLLTIALLMECVVTGTFASESFRNLLETDSAISWILGGFVLAPALLSFGGFLFAVLTADWKNITVALCSMLVFGMSIVNVFLAMNSFHLFLAMNSFH